MLLISNKKAKFINRKKPQDLCVLGLMACSNPRTDIAASTKEGIYCPLPIKQIFVCPFPWGSYKRGGRRGTREEESKCCLRVWSPLRKDRNTLDLAILKDSKNWEMTMEIERRSSFSEDYKRNRWCRGFWTRGQIQRQGNHAWGRPAARKGEQRILCIESTEVIRV